MRAQLKSYPFWSLILVLQWWALAAQVLAQPQALFNPVNPSESELSALTTNMAEFSALRPVMQQVTVRHEAPSEGVAELAVELPDGELITLVQEHFEDRVAGDALWQGRVSEFADSEVSLTFKNELLVGRIRIGEDTYEIRPLDGPVHVIERLDLAAFPSCITESPPVLPQSATGLAAFSEARGMATYEQELDSDEPIYVDVMSVYTASARDRVGGAQAVEAVVQAAVDSANMAFQRSDMRVRFNLVHVGEVGYTGDVSGIMSQALFWVATDAGVAALRDFHGADLVSIVVTADDACGAGYVQREPGPEFAGSAFQATNVSCAVGNLSYAHEHGHNLGMEHNPEDSDALPEEASHPWAYGHFADGIYRTIMSYSSPCNGACRRVMQFSNPTIDFEGVATGVWEERDNAQAGDLNALIVRDFRESVVPPPEGVLAVRVGTWDDDAQEDVATGSMALNRSTLTLGMDSGAGSEQVLGLRFLDVRIPPGAEIYSAYLEFVAADGASSTTDIVVQALAADDVPPFLTTPFDLTSRAVTQASVEWRVPAWDLAGGLERSPDISALIQEVVDRESWYWGNDLGVLLHGSGHRLAESSDGDAGAAPLLRVEYEVINVPPEADFSVSTSDHVTWRFTDDSIDVDGVVISWSWDFGDGGTSTQANPSHQFSAPGDYQVTLTVMDDQGGESSISQIVNVGYVNTPPAADFSVAVDFLNVTFTDMSSDSDGSIVAWLWDFGDGGSSSSRNPTHAYASGSRYNVTLSVTDNEGATTSVRKTVYTIVPNAPPVVRIRSVKDSDQPRTYHFFDQSTDYDGQKVAWLWEFDDGTTSIQQNVTHRFTGVGSHLVRLSVTDDDGAVGTGETYTIILNTKPQPGFGWVANGLAVTFTDTSTDDDAVVSWRWAFGDGNASHEQNPTHVFSAPGTYTMGLSIRDSDGSSAVVAQEITVEAGANTPPNAQFEATQNGLTVDFTDSSSDPDGTLVAWFWDFGDGNTSTAPNPQHVYAAVGSYTVSLLVTDDAGASHSISQSVTVNAPNQAPIAGFNLAVDALSVAFSDTSSDLDGSIVAWSWDFGDGTTSTEQHPLHTYAAPGNYSVSLTVTDDTGTEATTTQTVTVGAVTPANGPRLQVGRLVDVGSDNWVTVTLPYSYDAMVVVANITYQDGDPPAVVRIRNAAADQFELRVQNPSDESLSGLVVDYLVVEEGVYTEAEHGIKLEAVTYESATTDRSGAWAGESRGYQQAYSQPVVLGQVMSYQDPLWSVFWSRGSARTNPADDANLGIGKHVGEDLVTTRMSETVGYIVVESGTGQVNGQAFVAGLGPDKVIGLPGVVDYAVSDMPETVAAALVSQAGMDGNNGGWAVLVGPNSAEGGILQLAIDEDQVKDEERAHGSEQVGYLVFGPVP